MSVLLNPSTALFLIAPQCPNIWADYHLLNVSPIVGHTGYFQFFSIVNRIAVIVFVAHTSDSCRVCPEGLVLRGRAGFERNC